MKTPNARTSHLPAAASRHAGHQTEKEQKPVTFMELAPFGPQPKKYDIRLPSLSEFTKEFELPKHSPKNHSLGVGRPAPGKPKAGLPRNPNFQARSSNALPSDTLQGSVNPIFLGDTFGKNKPNLNASHTADTQTLNATNSAHKKPQLTIGTHDFAQENNTANLGKAGAKNRAKPKTRNFVGPDGRAAKADTPGAIPRGTFKSNKLVDADGKPVPPNTPGAITYDTYYRHRPVDEHGKSVPRGTPGSVPLSIFRARRLVDVNGEPVPKGTPGAILYGEYRYRSRKTIFVNIRGERVDPSTPGAISRIFYHRTKPVDHNGKTVSPGTPGAMPYYKYANLKRLKLLKSDDH